MHIRIMFLSIWLHSWTCSYLALAWSSLLWRNSGPLEIMISWYFAKYKIFVLGFYALNKLFSQMISLSCHFCELLQILYFNIEHGLKINPLVTLYSNFDPSNQSDSLFSCIARNYINLGYLLYQPRACKC